MSKRSWCVCIVTLIVPALAAAAAAGGGSLTVRSTLRAKTALPHRIHWYAFPSLPPSKISEVDFRIDGRLAWVEHNAPYSYGYNDNYLVTTWLTAGNHRFETVAVSTTGQRATTQTVARVLPASPPPAALAGTWARTMTKAETKEQPAGTWRLTINKIGWRIEVPTGGANLIDVAYLGAGLLESRGGIWTRPHPADNPTEGNGWCDEPFQPVRYHWSVSGNTLTLSLAGPKRCDGESVIWAGSWSRSG